MNVTFWGAVLRLSQAAFQAAPTILVGLVVAGVLRHLLGHAGTRRLFGDNTWRSLPQAWLVGMLLPVCSLGVIPVIREMRRAGVAGGAILAFGLTAPLFNPISVLYGLTLADPVVILTFSFCSLVIVTVVGLVWDHLFPNTSVPEPEPPAVARGAKRMLSIALFAARESVSTSAIYIAIGLTGVTILSVVLPHAYLQRSAEPDDPWAPLFMSIISIPIYATPMTAMVQLASMFQHGNSVGAAFALLVLGAGANLGLVAWMVVNYRALRTSAWFAFLVALVIGLAYGVDKPLYPHGVDPAGHTHAFDIYCAPYPPSFANPMQRTFHKLREDLAPHESISLMILAAIVAAGAGLARFDPDRRVEQWLQRPPGRRAKLDVDLPAPVLGAVALAILIGLSLFGCYVYYPPPAEIFEEMKIVNTEVGSATLSGEWETARYWIPIYDDWTRKLQVSMVLRGEELTPYRRAKADVLREKLELLEHKVEDRELDESRELGRAVGKSYARVRRAYESASH